jgi:hypothetical protein
LKRALVHVGAFNLGLVLLTLIGVSTPRGLQGRAAALSAALWYVLARTIAPFLDLAPQPRFNHTRLSPEVVA